MPEKISDADITGLNIPTGIPLAYELDAAPLKPGGISTRMRRHPPSST